MYIPARQKKTITNSESAYNKFLPWSVRFFVFVFVLLLFRIALVKGV